MSTMLLERSPFKKGFERDTRRRLDGVLIAGPTEYGELTLDELITSVWESLAVRDTAECPVCSGPMVLGSYGDEDAQRASSCRRCGSQLS